MRTWEARENDPAYQLYSEALYAAMDKDLGKLKRLVAQGVDLNYPDDDGYSPLWHAINEYDVKTVRFLLEAGAALTRRDDGKTALGTARELFRELSWTEKPKGMLLKGAALFAKIAGRGNIAKNELKALREIIHLLEERMGIPKTDF
jgi:Ankyrin repeats (3 copies)